MGANIKQLKNRIRSVNSTMHITKAMELVASSKMRKATVLREAGVAYSDAVDGIMSRLSGVESVFTSPRDEKKILIITVAGDRGLAGGYNNDIFKKLKEFSEGRVFEVVPVGKRMVDYLKGHDIPFGRSYISVEKIMLSDIAELGSYAAKAFADESVDAVYVLYTRFLSVLSHEVALEKILPISESENAESAAMLFEPDEESVLSAAVPEYVSGKIYGCVAESFLSELSARRNAMDSASKNASEMIDDLNLRYNRARQGAITQEITEIIGGSETK